jgi:carbamoyl-phosphate synthase large subunit
LEDVVGRVAAPEQRRRERAEERRVSRQALGRFVGIAHDSRFPPATRTGDLKSGGAPARARAAARGARRETSPARASILAPRPMPKLLVTGVGSNIGQGILKSLRAASIGGEIVGTDMFRFAAGAAWCDKVYLVPPAREASYLATLAGIAKRHQSQLVLVGSELETHVLAAAKARLEKETGATIVTSSGELVEQMGDKWGVCQLFAKAGLERADSTIDMAERRAFAKRHKYPVVIKPRHGWSARGVQIIEDDESLDFFAKHVPEPILQEHLTGEEYTCAVVFDRDANYRDHVVMRRDLLNGTTFRAEIVSVPAIDSYISAFAKSVRAQGPINVQLRLTPRGPVAFEINPRFSGTTAIRMRAGFNDVAAIVRNYLEGTPIERMAPRKCRILRYWEEVVVEEGDPRFGA